MIFMSRFSRMKELVEPKTTGYVVAGITCRCSSDRSVPTLINGELFCKYCGYPFKFTVVNKRIYGSLDVLEGSVASDEGYKVIRDQNDNLKIELEKADSQIKEQEKTIMKLEQSLHDVALERDSYLQKCSELENAISERESRLKDTEEGYRAEIEKMKGELESSRSDVDAYRRQVESLECRTSDLDQLVKDLKDTNNHSRMELQRNTSLDVRDVISSVMKYAAAVNNKLIDDQNLDSIRMFVDARTEGLFMDLGKEGIKVTRHKRGEELGDGRMEIVEKPTNSPEQDMKVAKSNSYGVVFRDELFPMIPESVSVFRFVQSDE